MVGFNANDRGRFGGTSSGGSGSVQYTAGRQSAWPPQQPQHPQPVVPPQAPPYQQQVQPQPQPPPVAHHAPAANSAYPMQPSMLQQQQQYAQQQQRQPFAVPQQPVQRTTNAYSTNAQPISHPKPNTAPPAASSYAPLQYVQRDAVSDESMELDRALLQLDVPATTSNASYSTAPHQQAANAYQPQQYQPAAYQQPHQKSDPTHQYQPPQQQQPAQQQHQQQNGYAQPKPAAPMSMPPPSATFKRPSTHLQQQNQQQHQQQPPQQSYARPQPMQQPPTPTPPIATDVVSEDDAMLIALQQAEAESAQKHNYNHYAASTTIPSSRAVANDMMQSNYQSTTDTTHAYNQQPNAYNAPMQNGYNTHTAAAGILSPPLTGKRKAMTAEDAYMFGDAAANSDIHQLQGAPAAHNKRIAGAPTAELLAPARTASTEDDARIRSELIKSKKDNALKTRENKQLLERLTKAQDELNLVQGRVMVLEQSKTTAEKKYREIYSQQQISLTQKSVNHVDQPSTREQLKSTQQDKDEIERRLHAVEGERDALMMQIDEEQHLKNKLQAETEAIRMAAKKAGIDLTNLVVKNGKQSNNQSGRPTPNNRRTSSRLSAVPMNLDADDDLAAFDTAGSRRTPIAVKTERKTQATSMTPAAPKQNGQSREIATITSPRLSPSPLPASSAPLPTADQLETQRKAREQLEHIMTIQALISAQQPVGGLFGLIAAIPSAASILNQPELHAFPAQLSATVSEILAGVSRPTALLPIINQMLVIVGINAFNDVSVADKQHYTMQLQQSHLYANPIDTLAMLPFDALSATTPPGSNSTDAAATSSYLPSLYRSTPASKLKSSAPDVRSQAECCHLLLNDILCVLRILVRQSAACRCNILETASHAALSDNNAAAFQPPQVGQQNGIANATGADPAILPTLFKLLSLHINDPAMNRQLLLILRTVLSDFDISETSADASAQSSKELLQSFAPLWHDKAVLSYVIAPRAHIDDIRTMLLDMLRICMSHSTTLQCLSAQISGPRNINYPLMALIQTFISFPSQTATITQYLRIRIVIMQLLIQVVVNFDKEGCRYLLLRDPSKPTSAPSSGQNHRRKKHAINWLTIEYRLPSRLVQLITDELDVLDTAYIQQMLSDGEVYGHAADSAAHTCQTIACCYLTSLHAALDQNASPTQYYMPPSQHQPASTAAGDDEHLIHTLRLQLIQLAFELLCRVCYLCDDAVPTAADGSSSGHDTLRRHFRGMRNHTPSIITRLSNTDISSSPTLVHKLADDATKLHVFLHQYGALNLAQQEDEHSHSADDTDEDDEVEPTVEAPPARVQHNGLNGNAAQDITNMHRPPQHNNMPPSFAKPAATVSKQQTLMQRPAPLQKHAKPPYQQPHAAIEID